MMVSTAGIVALCCRNGGSQTPDRWLNESRNTHSAIQEFYKIIYSKRDDRIEEWLIKLEQFNIPELQTYVNGVRNDLNAVKNGIKYEYNNGLAEGSVNKIKVIKRIMYGRNSFELLKAKVLLHEQFCFSVN